MLMYVRLNYYYFGCMFVSMTVLFDVCSFDVCSFELLLFWMYVSFRCVFF